MVVTGPQRFSEGSRMAAESPGHPLANLRLFLSSQTPSDVSDRELLDRFLRRQDEAAFAALVQRHGPMVLGVCRRVLRNPHDAEDACQATFLILSRKAAAIRKPDALASWLHGVAVRVARDLRAALARRAARPLQAGDDIARPAEEALTWAEVRQALDEELLRLPEHYRSALVLCYLQGRSRDEAALQLGWSLPTLRGRLERGRALLHARLVRRGLTLSAGLIAGALAADRAAAAVPARLLLEIVRSLTGPAAGGAAAASPQVTTLVNGVLAIMNPLKKKYLIAVILVGLLAAGGYAAYHYYAAEPLAEAWTAALTPQEVNAEETVQLGGRVLDPNGQPLEGAELYLVAGWNSPLNDGPPLGHSGKDGRFTLAAPKSELARHFAAARPVVVVAVAKGFGMAWGPAADFLPKQERDKVGPISRFAGGLWASPPVLKLTGDDAPLSGRIETPEGKPLAGATVRLEWVYANDANDLTAWSAAIARKEDFNAARKHLPRELGCDGLGRFAATTDKEGHFQLTGIGANRVVSLRLGGPGLAAATIVARTQRGPRLDTNLASFSPDPHGCFGADFALTAAPARPIVGVVRDADTGRPVPGAIVLSHRFAGNQMTGVPLLRTRADAQGRYRLDGMPAGKGNALLVRGPADQPYIAAVTEVDTSNGDGPVKLELKVKRGLWAEGRVTDAATGRPLAADVDYYCLASNPRGAAYPGFDFAFLLGGTGYHTDAAGRFRVPVVAGRGIVAAKLHGQRSWTIFSKVSSTWQAGKSYTEYRGRFDPPDAPATHGGWFVLAHPCHFVVMNYHQMAVIDPAEDATSVTCDLPVYADGSPLKPAQTKEAGR
jgi:RNA polymerase sigma factor (sigma-70 family)